MVKIVVKYFILLLLLNINLSAQSVSALASVDSVITWLVIISTYSLEIRADKNIEITTPFIRDSLKKVEMIKEIEPLIK